jgi:hypothetical protein
VGLAAIPLPLGGERMKTYRSVGEFAADSGRIAANIGRFGDVLLSDTAGEVNRRVQREPVGPTGRLKGSRVFIRGGAGQPSIIGWTAPYAQIIARGRKRSKPYKRKGASKLVVRMLGSKQARSGFIRPMFFGLRRDWPTVVNRAAAKVGE